MKKPHFIGLGVQKGATSWIYSNLVEHPQVYIATKETHFFSTDHKYKLGTSWYQEQFKRCDKSKICGEISTSYFSNLEVIDRILKYGEETKLFVCLRNPVTRIISSIKNDLKSDSDKNKKQPLELFVENEEYYLSKSLYAESLELILQRHGHGLFKVFLYEDIELDPEIFLIELFDFLGIDSNVKTTMRNKRVNHYRLPRNIWIDNAMSDMSRRVQRFGMGKLIVLLRSMGLIEMLRDINTRRNFTPKNFSDVASEILRRHGLTLESDIKKTEALINRDLSGWKCDIN